MGIPRFFKVKEPNRFNYNPLYWDPAKEEFEDRVRRIKAELGQDVDYNRKSSTITRGSFRNYTPGTNRKAGRESNVRLFVITVVLMLLSYLLFFR
jgi:hypothetical protein